MADFLRATGPAMELMMDMFDRMPNVAFTIKNAEGRIMYTNRYNAEVSGWKHADDLRGYTSEELYPPDQAAVYAGRDREVMESGIPIVERVYGFVADRSDSLNCVTVRPVVGLDGTRVGTATVYWRAQQKMQAANWYNPIRRSIVYLNEHYAPIVCTVAGMEIRSNEMQSINARMAILASPEGRITSSSLLHCSNAIFPIISTAPVISTFLRFLHA